MINMQRLHRLLAVTLILSSRLKRDDFTWIRSERTKSISKQKRESECAERRKESYVIIAVDFAVFVDFDASTRKLTSTERGRLGNHKISCRSGTALLFVCVQYEPVIRDSDSNERPRQCDGSSVSWSEYFNNDSQSVYRMSFRPLGYRSNFFSVFFVVERQKRFRS